MERMLFAHLDISTSYCTSITTTYSSKLRLAYLNLFNFSQSLTT